MKLSEIKDQLKKLEHITFQLPNGELVPQHFHITEVGKVTRHFIDCGGTERLESFINFQLWSADDYEHRLTSEKLLKIIEIAENTLNLENLEIEVEYQNDTIGKFGLDFDGENFLLTSKQTDCLAKDQCGIPEEKPKVNLSDLSSKESCTPGGGCC